MEGSSELVKFIYVLVLLRVISQQLGLPHSLLYIHLVFWCQLIKDAVGMYVMIDIQSLLI